LVPTRRLPVVGRRAGRIRSGRRNAQEAIQEADELSRRVRVEGVPFFVINGKVTLSGAQPPEAFIEALKQAHRTMCSP